MRPADSCEVLALRVTTLLQYALNPPPPEAELLHDWRSRILSTVLFFIAPRGLLTAIPGFGRVLAARGLRFSIDDFGTGDSSLAHPQRLQLRELKIDRRCIADTPQDPGDTAIVSMILSMARHLGLQVVAERVETQAQADVLAAHGGDTLRGLLYARPQPLEQWLASTPHHRLVLRS